MKKKFLVFLVFMLLFCTAFGTSNHPKIIEAAFPIFNQLKGQLYPPSGWSGGIGIEALSSGNLHTDLCSPYNVVSYCGDLDWLYGDCPCGGSYEVLHATRNWKGMDDLSRVDSAAETCTLLRQRIIDASIRSLEHYRKGNRDTALYFLSHTTHLIEDSFSPGHTLRDPKTMQLVDHCTSSQDTSVMNWKGNSLEKVCDHYNTENKDQLFETVNEKTRFTTLGRGAVFADIGYLIAMKELYAYAGDTQHTVDQLKVEAARRLNVYFDSTSTESFSLPPILQSGVVTKAQKYPVSGYFRCDQLSTDVPAYAKNELLIRPDNDWTHFTGYTIDSKPGYFAYKKASGTYALDWLQVNAKGEISINESGRGRIEKDWDLLLAFSSGQQSFLVAYRNNGILRGYSIAADGKSITPLHPASAKGWPAGLTSFFTLTIDSQPYALGHVKGSSDLYISALTSAGIEAPKKFALGDLLQGISHVQGFLFQNQPFLIAYHPDQKQTALFKLNSGALTATRKGQQLVDKNSITRFNYQWDRVLPLPVTVKDSGGMVVSKTSPALHLVRHGLDNSIRIDLLRQEQNTLSITTLRTTEPNQTNIPQWLAFQAGGKSYVLMYAMPARQEQAELRINSISP